MQRTIGAAIPLITAISWKRIAQRLSVQPKLVRSDRRVEGNEGTGQSRFAVDKRLPARNELALCIEDIEQRSQSLAVERVGLRKRRFALLDRFP